MHILLSTHWTKKDEDPFRRSRLNLQFGAKLTWEQLSPSQFVHAGVRMAIAAYSQEVLKWFIVTMVIANWDNSINNDMIAAAS
jgi:hypothetical protein